MPACVGTREPLLFLEIQLLSRELLDATVTTAFDLRARSTKFRVPDDQFGPSHRGSFYPSGSVLNS